MKEFITAVEAAVEGDVEERKPIPFMVDGTVCHADKEPGDGALAMWMASTSQHSELQEEVAGTIMFFFSVLDDKSAAYIQRKLFDRKDKFGVVDVQAILSYLIEEWSGRPTGASSDSTESPAPTGPSSTRPTRDLTSSGSAQIAS